MQKTISMWGALLVALMLATTGCNTLEGAGEDVQEAGEEIQDAAD